MKLRLTVRCLGWFTDATKTTRVHEPMILRQGDPGGAITDTCCPRCRDAFVAQLPKKEERDARSASA